MPITVTPAPEATYSLTEAFDLLQSLITAGEIVGRSPGGSAIVVELETSAGLVRAEVDGRNLTVVEGNNGFDVLSSGRLDAMNISLDGELLATLTDLDVTAGQLNRARANDEIEELLLSREWDFTGTGAPDDSVGRSSGFRFFNFTGDDRFDGAGGRDRLFSGDGDDTVLGSLGRDYLVGGDGRDRIEGGDARDLLAGARGQDTLLGGDGADAFGILRGEGRDRILDFTDGEDTLYVAAQRFRDLDIVDRGDFTVVRGEGWMLRLDGVSADAFTAEDFNFLL